MLELPPEGGGARERWIFRAPSFILAGIALGGAILGGLERIVSLYESIEKTNWQVQLMAKDIQDLKEQVHDLLESKPRDSVDPKRR